MAYMRGKTYIWQDEHRLHIWTHDGYDGWDISGWAVDAGETRHPDKQCASGTAIPQETMDEYVVMRLAELYREGILESTIHLTFNHQQGNFGCDALKSSQGRLLKKEISEPSDTEWNCNQETFTDMNWLVNHPDQTLGSKYHDTGSCWTLIDECLNEIRRLRKSNN